MPYDARYDPYINPSTGILRNLLGIRSEQELEDAEARLTAIEIQALTTEPDHAKFTLDLFTSIHKQLFKDIYEWAGELRTVELSKGHTRFAPAEFLRVNLQKTLELLAKDNYLVGLSQEDFIERLAHYYGEFIVLHPFREGNGRSIRTFLALVAEHASWHLAWDQMDREENIRASIAAYHGDEEPMRSMLRGVAVLIVNSHII